MMGNSDNGREAFAHGAWGAAYELLAAADGETPLQPEDLDCLASAAYLTGRDAEAIGLWTRAYRGFIDQGHPERAARCGFWLSHSLLLMGDGAKSSGWLARTRRLIDDRQLDCAERGYLLVVDSLLALGAGDAAGSYAINGQIVKLADRFGDADLRAFGLLGEGKALIELGECAKGVQRLDEAMVAVTAGEVSPIVTGFLYCAVILSCRKLFDWRRCREWTAALADWCASQPDLVPFRGQCLVHRSEIMQLHGAWSDALTEARQACRWLAAPPQPALAMAYYQLGEIHRLRGDFQEAETAYRDAAEWGFEPQPGLSQLRLGQGRLDAAEAGIRRAKDESQDPLSRARLLGVFVEVMIAINDLAAARAAADEMSKIAATLDAPFLLAASKHASGSVSLAEGDARSALVALRRAWTLYQDLDARYEAARIRVQIACACRELGDLDASEMEFSAARSTFQRLGATPDLVTVERLSAPAGAQAPGGLTAREVEVLALVAAGKSNRQIATELVLSERTVARHMANIFTKLGVSSRAAATAYAYQHHLV